MAKNIALTLTIGGVKQNITNIKELETAIKGAEDQLKGLAIGSEGFKKLSSDVKNAKSVLEDFNQSVQGQDLEKRVGAFAKVGEGITASFAGAQAAISLFGTESEAVAEAAAKAQSVLTIALAARSAAEGVVAVRTVAANIATYASAAAANAATTATRVLWATLAANPFGAILAVVGALVALYVTLTDSTKEQVNVQAELNKTTSDEARNLTNSLVILTQFNSQRELQTKELEKLKKEYPGFNAFIDKENKLNQQGVKFLQLKIKQYELEAQAKLITQKIAENSIKILEIESRSILENVSFWESAWNTIKAGGNISIALLNDAKTGLENQRKEVAAVTAENERWRKSLGDVYVQTDEVLRQLRPFEQTLTTQVETEKRLNTAKENAKKTQEELAAAYKKGLTDIITFRDQIEKLNEAFKQYDQTVKNLESLTVSAKLVEDLEKIKQARIEGAKQFSLAADQIKVGIESLTKIEPDTFLNIFQSYRQELEQAFTQSGQSIDKFKKIFQKFVDNNKDLNQAQVDSLFQVYKGYEDFTNLLTTTPGFDNVIKSLNSLKSAYNANITTLQNGYGDWFGFLQILGDITAASGQFKLEVDDLTGEVKDFSFDPTKVQQNAKEAYSVIRQGLIVPLTQDLLEQKQKSIESLIPTLSGTDLSKAQGELKKVQDAIKKFKEDGTLDIKILDPKEIQQAVNQTIEQFNRILGATVKAEQSVFAVNKQVQQLTKELSGNTAALGSSIANVLSQNLDTVIEKISKLRTKQQQDNQKFQTQAKDDAVGFAKFQENLVKEGILTEEQLRTIGQENLLRLYAQYLQKEVNLTKDAEDEKEKARALTQQRITKGIELFSQSINQISAITQERVRTDLQSLEIAEKRTLEKVVGESESAAKKRLEIQEEYNNKRKELEKKAAVQQLQFSLVQSIAQAAQAVVNILQSTAIFGPAGPVVAGGLIALTAGLTAAQIAIISDQISNAQAMRRGGVLKAQGGMILRGPSHENGGIPLAQMGVIAEGNEAIINRQSTMNFQDLLSTINQSGGGRPLVMNNFDDSRIVEALAKQQQKPIRAYVLESDITNEQLISKRLDTLSKF